MLFIKNTLKPQDSFQQILSTNLLQALNKLSKILWVKNYSLFLIINSCLGFPFYKVQGFDAVTYRKKKWLVYGDLKGNLV